jgi:hypothetical protein
MSPFQSGGLPHFKTLARHPKGFFNPEVLECGGLLPLSMHLPGTADGRLWPQS